ncbi:MAG: FtsX-like permease family protein [Pseudomonadota bacterium]
MSLNVAAKIAARELRGGLHGFRIFLACVILGVAAIAAIGTVRDSIAEGLAQEGATLLGGDAEIELTYRFADQAELDWMEQTASRVSEIADFRSMAVNGEARSLTQIKAVDDAYPLIGEPRLSPDIPLQDALKGKDGLPGLVMQPILAERLSLEAGDTVRLGTKDFVLMAMLEREPDTTTAGFGLGPRSIVRKADLDGSGLLQPGTLFSARYRLDLPTGTDLAAIKNEAEEALDGSGLRWSDARNGAPGTAQFVDRLGAFLILVGLSGLAVGGVGISAALQAYMGSKTKVIAILRTLGADQRTVFMTYLIQVCVLAILGILAGLILGVGIPVLLAPIIEARLPVPAVFAVYTDPMIEAVIYSILTVMIFTLWPLAQAREVRPAALYRDGGTAKRWPAPFFITLTVGILSALIAVASWFSGNTTITLWTACGIIGSLAALTIAGLGLRTLARIARPAARGRVALGWALGAISGPGSTASAAVLSLGLGLSVLATIGQVDRNLRDAIVSDLPDRAPSYFFVDIQRDQMPGFSERLDSDVSVSRVDAAPMLRGVITKINGRPARETAGDHWVLEGDRGVSYAAALPSRSIITDGQWWNEDYSGQPQVSFAEEEGEEMGIKLGDEITVNILGRDITAEVTSFREVDFSTAGMGFIMIMNEAALVGAPHSFIATVYAEEAAEAAILRDLSGKFPNITAIRVKDAVEQVGDLLAGLASATAYGASATLLTGFLVLIGAAAADQRARSYEAAILKTLGATRVRILWGLSLRAAMLGAAAGSVAIGAGITGAWAVSRYIMSTDFEIAWGPALGIVAGGAFISLLVGLIFAFGPMSARPAQTLRAGE